jgi:hypothetical protein
MGQAGGRMASTFNYLDIDTLACELLAAKIMI